MTHKCYPHSDFLPSQSFSFLTVPQAEVGGKWAVGLAEGFIFRSPVLLRNTAHIAHAQLNHKPLLHQLQGHNQNSVNRDVAGTQESTGWLCFPPTGRTERMGRTAWGQGLCALLTASAPRLSRQEGRGSLSRGLASHNRPAVSEGWRQEALRGQEKRSTPSSTHVTGWRV